MKENILNDIIVKKGLPVNSCVKLFVICGLLIIYSCKARKQILVNRKTADSTVIKPIEDKTVKLNAIKATQTYFNTFSGKARTQLDIGGNSNDVTLNIRISRDKKIWVSVTAIAGIEVARALITPDSIMVINRLQSLYVKQPFNYINKLAGKQVNYNTLQSILIGNAIPELLTENSNFETTAGNITLTGNLQDIVYKLFLGPDLKVTQTNLSNQSAGQTLQVVNNTFIQAGNRVVPSQIDMASIVKDKKIQVNLHYIKMDFDQPQEYPFIIPARYSEAN